MVLECILSSPRDMFNRNLLKLSFKSISRAAKLKQRINSSSYKFPGANKVFGLGVV